MGLTADGASINRRLIRLHDPKGNLLNKTSNPFVKDGSRPFLFFCDPPHLIKTVRNCWASKSRSLWVCTCICIDRLMYICTCINNLCTCT